MYVWPFSPQLFSSLSWELPICILLATPPLLPGLWRLRDPLEKCVTSTQRHSLSKAALLMDLTYTSYKSNWCVNLESWGNDGLAGTFRAFTSLEASNTGLLTVSFSCAYLVSSEFPKSWDGWSPPGNQISCLPVKSTATLTQQSHWLVCLQATWKGERLPQLLGWNPVQMNILWCRSRFHPWWQGTPPSGQQIWGRAPACGTNSSSTKRSHRPLLPSTLSRSNWVCFFFRLFSWNLWNWVYNKSSLNYT